jgi:hypothetical protein
MSPPDYTGVWKVLYDWQTITAGALAIVGAGIAYMAGIIQARATREAADKQIAAVNRTEQLQARCIAVGVAPELEALKISHKNASRTIDAVAELDQSTSIVAHKVLNDACIEIPPILARNIDHLHLLGQTAGPTLLQLVSVTLQYNHMIATQAKELKEHPHFMNPSKLKKDFSGHLKVIAELIDMADREIEGLHP